MLEALSTPRNRITTFVLLAMCGLLAIGAAVVGISDNPPGIGLAFLSAIALVLAFVHPWRTSRQYRYLFYMTFVVFFLSAVMHNVLEVLGHRLGGGLVGGALQGAGVLFFLVAVLLCPPALVVGAVGAVGLAIRDSPQRALLVGAALLVLVSSVIAMGVIPAVKADTFPMAAPDRAATAFWVNVVLSVLVAAMLALTAVRATKRSRPSTAFLCVVGFFVLVLGLALTDAAFALQSHGPAMDTASVLLFLSAAADLIAGMLAVSAALLLPKQTSSS